MKKIFIAFWLLSFAAICFGQEQKEKLDGQPKPNFSGIWVLDKSRSDYRRASGTPLSKIEMTLVIEHREPEIRVRRTATLGAQESVQDLVYYSDERGEKNPILAGKGFVETKTKWKDKKLVSSYSYALGVNSEVIWLNVVQEWTISKDGRTLTQTEMTLPRNRFPATSLLEMAVIKSVANSIKRVFSLKS